MNRCDSEINITGFKNFGRIAQDIEFSAQYMDHKNLSEPDS